MAVLPSQKARRTILAARSALSAGVHELRLLASHAARAREHHARHRASWLSLGAILIELLFYCGRQFREKMTVVPR